MAAIATVVETPEATASLMQDAYWASHDLYVYNIGKQPTDQELSSWEGYVTLDEVRALKNDYNFYNPNTRKEIDGVLMNGIILSRRTVIIIRAVDQYLYTALINDMRTALHAGKTPFAKMM
jgi:hypothetical protein